MAKRISRIIELHLQGFNREAITERLDVGKDTVNSAICYYRKANGIKIPKPDNSARDAEIIRLHLLHWLPKLIAAEMKLNRSVIAGVLNRYRQRGA